MPRVGILTFHHANNYGAVLQAYGLSKALADMGHDVQVIDYRPATARQHYEPRLPRRQPRVFCREFLYRHRFNRFRRRLLPLSKTYLAADELEHSPPSVDAVICGSDQIWNVTSYRGFDPSFFLNFIQGDSPKRISYAATFGGATEADLGDNAESARQLLARFDHLSVRDAQSLEVLKSLTGRSASHVLDPSFLVEFDAITPPRLIKHPYIFTYCLNPSAILREAVPYLAQTLDLPVISVKTPIEGATTLRPGPLQWLSLLRHAEFVCTDSFHGTCFSIKDRKPFISLPSWNGMTRIEDLLGNASLTDRIVTGSADLRRATAETIDFDIVAPRIEEARAHSLAFLAEAIQ